MKYCEENKIKFSLLFILFIIFLIHVFICLRCIGSEGSGLRLIPQSSKLFDISNMNPGQRVSFTKAILNAGSKPFELILKLRKQSKDILQREPDLLKQLNLAITIDGHTIFSGSILDFANEENGASLGLFKSGDIKEFIVTAYLPGAETGNQFQGLSADSEWSFETKCVDVSRSYCCMPIHFCCLLLFHIVIFAIMAICISKYISMKMNPKFRSD